VPLPAGFQPDFPTIRLEAPVGIVVIVRILMLEFRFLMLLHHQPFVDLIDVPLLQTLAKKRHHRVMKGRFLLEGRKAQKVLHVRVFRDLQDSFPVRRSLPLLNDQRAESQTG
jgi:hypothetical protein